MTWYVLVFELMAAPEVWKRRSSSVLMRHFLQVLRATSSGWREYRASREARSRPALRRRGHDLGCGDPDGSNTHHAQFKSKKAQEGSEGLNAGHPLPVAFRAV
ncbi:MAG: hypothetical protein EKK45_12765 [Curvibacter sp.]|nr:MAG: hypothetical protein EKK45_12765 [Curvibacter sp.]